MASLRAFLRRLNDRRRVKILSHLGMCFLCMCARVRGSLDLLFYVSTIRASYIVLYILHIYTKRYVHKKECFMDNEGFLTFIYLFFKPIFPLGYKARNTVHNKV